ncbi:MAG: hypothetical protein IKW33_00800 [Clostridia bacterium]|nr:hypothetical protein [Clostridia bacterium]
MAYGETKVYNDGSHYIAIPHTTRPKRKKSKKIETNKEIELKEIADKVFSENKDKRRKEKIEILKNEVNEIIKDEKATKEFVKTYMDKKIRNLIERRKRLARKINLGQWNYFCTFTYDDKKHSEESFMKKLKNCFKKLCYRKGWIYIGVWERSPEKKRLHFHGLFYIPDNAMVGELKEVNDYSFSSHTRQVTLQNTYFNERFGRSDFKPIDRRVPQILSNATQYLMKYLEKSGERIVYSKNTPTYFISDIMDEDIACVINSDKGEKLILFDNFSCWDEGCYMGEVSPEVISQMRKAN